MARSSGKSLVVVADDFGRSSSVNRAIAEAHANGIVTAASIMAGGEAFEEAVRIAGKNSALSVGLHVTLCDGSAVLPPSKIPGLVDGSGRFEKSPSLAWIKYYRTEMRREINREIKAQFDRVEKAGIHPTHVDSHHHIHMHPGIFPLLCHQASYRGVRWIRIPRESLSMVVRSAGRAALPFVEWLVFRLVGVSHKKKARLHGLQVADAVYGLSRTGQLDERYLLDLLNLADKDVVEIFSHPDSATMSGRREMDALAATGIRNRISSLGIMLKGYRELSDEAVILNMVPEKP